VRERPHRELKLLLLRAHDLLQDLDRLGVAQPLERRGRDGLQARDRARVRLLAQELQVRAARRARPPLMLPSRSTGTRRPVRARAGATGGGAFAAGDQPAPGWACAPAGAQQVAAAEAHVVLGALHVVLQRGKGHLGLDHEELGQVARGVAVLRAERRPERVHVGQRARVVLRLQLPRDRQEGRLAEEVGAVVHLAGLGAQDAALHARAAPPGSARGVGAAPCMQRAMRLPYAACAALAPRQARTASTAQACEQG